MWSEMRSDYRFLRNPYMYLMFDQMFPMYHEKTCNTSIEIKLPNVLEWKR